MRPGQDRNVLAVIPARFASTRFPGKVIAPLGGKPLVAHTYERVCKSARVSDVLVATDHPRVAEALVPLGIPVRMTSSEHRSGTDRIAEVAAASDAELIVNVQADEPLIDPRTIDAAIEALLDAPGADMSTARRPITDPGEVADSNVVKVVSDLRGNALYFSRAPIPVVRDDDVPPSYWQHIGLYVYRRAFLLRFAQWEPTPLERAEKLEQLRALEHGASIAVIDTAQRSIGVDRPEDLETVRGILEEALEGRR